MVEQKAHRLQVRARALRVFDESFQVFREVGVLGRLLGLGLGQADVLEQ